MRAIAILTAACLAATILPAQKTCEHCKPYDGLLTRLEIPHEFIVVPGIKHDPAGVYRVMGERAFEWYAKAFSKIQ